MRKVAAATAVALTASVLATLSPASATQLVTESRVAGLDRYATAAAVGQATFAAGNANIILVSGTNFPDGLAAAGLAGAASAPILLTAPDSLPAVTANAMAAIFGSSSTKTVHILGGESAISAAVATQVQSLGYTVNRISGADRYATAAAIATFQGTLGASAIGSTTVGGASLKTAILATGVNFPDALAAGTPAYSGKHPILLTAAASLPASTKTALTNLAIKRVIVLGGTSAVSDAVLTELTGLGISSTRISGADRGATAAALADAVVASTASGGFNLYGTPSSSGCLGTGVVGPNIALVVSGTNFADALAAGPHGGICKAPILIAGSAASAAFATANAAKIGLVRVIGGTSAVSAADLTALKTAATTATPTATITADQGSGVIRVDFSEKMDVTVAGDVRINNSSTGICATNSAVISAPSATGVGACIMVTLPGATSSYLLVGVPAAISPLVANDLVAVSDVETLAATGARQMAAVSTTVTAPSTAPTLAISGAAIGAGTVTLTYSRPMVALDETQISVAGTNLTAVADVDASSGRKTTFTVTVPTLAAGNVITVGTAAASAAAGTPAQISAAVSVTVGTAGAAPTATAAVSTLVETGGFVNTTPLADSTDVNRNVLVLAKSARPATGAGSLTLELINPLVPTAATTAASATNQTTGVITITVTLKNPTGGSVTATSSEVAAAINAGVPTLATAVASNPAASTPVVSLTATSLSVGSRTLSVALTFSRAIKPQALTAGKFGLDLNGDSFNDVPTASNAPTPSIADAAAGKATVTFDMGVGVAAKSVTLGTSTIRFADDATGIESTDGVKLAPAALKLT
jgi:putative cell wall-binding protein